MDKYEYRLKTEEMLRCVAENDYRQAESIADSIDWRRVKSVSMLCAVSDIYDECDRFEDAREILFIAYDRAPNNRKIIFGLTELAIKIGDLDEARDCFDEYVAVAPHDGNKFVLKYELLKAQKAPIEEQIKALEEFKQVEYTERWAYELARLYDKAGMTADCITECDDIFLWFSDGKYVRQALELKKKYRQLTANQEMMLKAEGDDEEYLEETIRQRKAAMLLNDQRRGQERQGIDEERLEQERQQLEQREIDRLRREDRIVPKDMQQDEDDMVFTEWQTREERQLYQNRDEVSFETSVQEMSYPDEDDQESEEFRLIGEEDDLPKKEEAVTQFQEEEAFRFNVRDEEEIRRAEELRNQQMEAEISRRVEEEYQRRLDGDMKQQLDEATAPLKQQIDDMNQSFRKQFEELAAQFREQIAVAKKEIKEAEIRAEAAEEAAAQAESERILALEQVKKAEDEASRQIAATAAAKAAAAEAANRAEEAEKARRAAEEIAAEQERRRMEEAAIAQQKQEAAAQKAMEEAAARAAAEEEARKAAEEARAQAAEEAAARKAAEAALVRAAEEEASRKAAEEAARKEAEEKARAERPLRKRRSSYSEDADGQMSMIPDDVQKLLDELSIGSNLTPRNSQKKAAFREDILDGFDQEAFDEEDEPEEVPDAEEKTAEPPVEPEVSAEPETPAELEIPEEPEASEEADFEDAFSDEEFEEADLDDVEFEEEFESLASDEESIPIPSLSDLEYEDDLDDDDPSDHTVEIAVDDIAAALENMSIPGIEDQPVIEPEPEPESEPEPVKNLTKSSVSYMDHSQNGSGLPLEEKFDLEAQGRVGTEAGLTEDQKNLFSYFVPVRGMSEQLVEVLRNDQAFDRSGTSSIGNLLVVGPQGSGKTVLAVDVVKAIQKQRQMKSGKIAIISADAFNKKNVPETIRKIQGGSLIIESAGKLENSTVRALNEVMEGQTNETLFVLEDQKESLTQMLEQNPGFAAKFNSSLEVPVFINDELVTFGQSYAHEHGFKIEEMGILALYSRIDMMQREDHAVTVAEVKDIMDAAFEHSKKTSMRRTMTNLFKRGEKSELIPLLEDDFA